MKKGVGKQAAFFSHDVFLFAVNLLIVGMLAYLFYEYLDNLEDNTITEQTFLTKDMALLLSTLHAAPGDVQLEYAFQGIDSVKYQYTFGKDNVTLSKEGSHFRMMYPFAADTLRPVRTSDIDNPSTIHFGVSGLIFVSDSYLPNSALLCPGLDTTEANWKSKLIVLDPGHGLELGKPTGLTGNNIEDFIVRLVTLNLMHSKYNLNTEQTREIAFVPIKERLAHIKPGSITLSLHLSNGGISVIYSLSGKKRIESKKLACLIGKQLQLAFPNVDIRLATGKQEILTDEIGVVIELGGVSENHLLQTPQLSDAIYKGLEEYHE